MKIFVNDIQVYAYHGVLSQERKVGGYFLVSVEVEIGHEQASQTDALRDTINYADICETVRLEMATPSQLLEHVAGRICHRLHQLFPDLGRVMVRIVKKTPPITGLQCEGCGVELTT